MHILNLKYRLTVPRLPLRQLLIGVSLLWLGSVLFALTHLAGYERSAGIAGQPPLHWQKSPPSTLVALDPAKPTLLMLVHPQCPCSRASLVELNRLSMLCPDRAAISVLFLRPAGYTKGWVETDLWRQASALPHVRVRVDENGQIARHFGISTSGGIVLYAPNGRLLYQGGLTGERGHEGDNAGLSEVASLLLGKSAQQAEQQAEQEPVYGCPLTANRRGGPP